MKRKHDTISIENQKELNFDDEDDDIILNILFYMNLSCLLNSSIISKKWRLFSLSMIRNNFDYYNNQINEHTLKLSIKEIEKRISKCFFHQPFIILYQKYYIYDERENIK